MVVNLIGKLRKQIKLMKVSYFSHLTALSYNTNPQAIYTSRLLDFKNLPNQKMLLITRSMKFIWRIFR
jgi:hypothetical protein